MNDKPIISVIIPVYKVEPYLKKCIESVIRQTYTNLQIILVDDGSPDNCGKICDEYALKDNRIKVIHKKNGGLSEARNIGINEANGEYIGFVDSDDYIEETMYEDLYNLIQAYKSDISICNFYVVTNNINEIKNVNNGIKVYNKLEILNEILLDRNIQSYAWNKLYKKSLFDDIQYPVGKKYEDIGTTFYILERCNRIVVSGKPEYYYLVRKDSIVNNNNEFTIIDYIDIIVQRYDYIENNKYKELNKYNRYYLAKTLITAYKDLAYLGKVGNECIEKVNNLYNKVKSIMEKYDSEIIDVFDDKQKQELYNILYK